MARRMSREQREEAFVEAARQMYREMEAWYDEHEAASFGEIEQELRQKRWALMGRGQEILINGRDQGVDSVRHFSHRGVIIPIMQGIPGYIRLLHMILLVEGNLSGQIQI